MIHDPYSLLYREPAGAVPAGTNVTLRARLTATQSVSYSLILVFPDGHTERRPAIREAERISVSFACPQTGLMQYAFFADRDGGRCYGPFGENAGLVPASLWPLTVYEPTFTTPEWYTNSICYQIFPDRFHKSSFADLDMRAETHRKMARRIFLHNDWQEEPEWKPRTGEKEYVPEDYYGGDLKGIEEKLPYLKTLGVSCLYLNPIFEADSNHRYNTADYCRIDPLLGTEEDFVSLTEKARKFGIHILLDGVFSHTGADSRYFDSKNTYGGGACHEKNSSYASWYRFERWPDKYECWWGFKTLPNVEETDPSYGEFIHGANGVLSHWQGCGAKGWRLDVADELPEVFIRDVRKRVKKNDPEAVLLGEVWEDASDKEGPEGRRTYVDGAELDGCMNYPLRKTILQYLNGEIDAYACEQNLWALYTHYPRPFYQACLNLLSSHDEVRALSYLSGAPDRFKASRAEQAAFIPNKNDLAKGKKLFLAATAMQMTMPGVPCIYYGDEAGLLGMGDPFNRRPYPWGREDHSLLNTVKTLCRLRNELPALHNVAHFRMGALSPGIFAVLRYTEQETVLLLINRDDEARTVSFYPSLLAHGPDGLSYVPFSGEYEDVLTGERFKACGTLRVRVLAQGFRLLIKS